MLKNLLRKFVSSVVIGLGLYVGVALASGYPTTVALLTNQTTSFPADMPDINFVLSKMNASVFSYFTMNGGATEVGQIGLPNDASFAANASVATVLGSVGPTGSHTTVQKWLIVNDGNGNTYYIPMF
jgi:hypothetical protein